MSETRNRFRAWLEHERGLGAYTFASEHNMYQAYKEATYAERERGQAEVARLRAALGQIESVGAGVPFIDTGSAALMSECLFRCREIARGALSTPAERLNAAFSTSADAKGMED